MTTDLGPVLARIYRAAGPSPRITFDHTAYSPSQQVHDLAAELGYGQEAGVVTGDPGEWNPTFVPDEKSAAWQRYWRLSMALFVAKEAGADPADVTLIREALGLKVNTDIEAEATR